MSVDELADHLQMDVSAFNPGKDYLRPDGRSRQLLFRSRDSRVDLLVELFDDLDFDAYPTWILVSVIDVNTIVVAPLGALVDLPTTLLDTRPTPSSTDARPYVVELSDEGVDLRDLLNKIELEMIEQALERVDGNKSQAARMLGLNRTTLVEKLRRGREQK